jgi:hypothetical protein
MSGTKELKDLLDRLKGEVGPGLPDRKEREELPAAAWQQPPPQPAARTDRFSRPYRAPEQAPSAGPQNSAWNENKESILFGMLASLTAALGGILAGFDYLVIIGSVFFSLFSLLMLLSLFRFFLDSRPRGGEASGLAARVDALSKKIETLSSRPAPGGGSPFSAGSSGRERELEQSVEELRVMVKSLTKAVGLK